MKPDTFSAGSTINTAYYSTDDCTCATINTYVSTSGDCYTNSLGARTKITAPTAIGSGPVSAPTTVISPVSSPVSSPVGTPTTSTPTTIGALSGFGFKAGYTDSTCTILAYAEVYPLNTCIFYVSEDDVASYAKITATSDKFVLQKYSDSACATAVGTAVPTPYTTACSSTKTKFFVQSTNQVPTTKTTATKR
jgi:hypothetical protein